jgi:hypothetical protein
LSLPVSERSKLMDHLFKRPKPLITFKLRQGNHLGPVTSDPIEQERLAQLEEHKRRQGQGAEERLTFQKDNHTRRLQRKPQHKLSPKVLSFEENLERTNKWLGQTFPSLFGPLGPTKVLDIHILRDLKQHYKHHQAISSKKAKYPQDLIIKAALNRYLVSDNYLLQLKKGTKRYNLNAEECGEITKEEEERAIQLLGLILENR